MRWNRICLPVVLLVILAASATVRAEDKPKKPAKEHSKAVVGVLTSISVSGDTVSLTVQPKEGEAKTLTMSASVNALVQQDGDKTVILGLHSAKGKGEKPKGDKVKLVAGTVTAASVSGEQASISISATDGAIQGTMSTKVTVMVDKDGNVVGLRSAAGHEKAPKAGADKKEKKEKKEKGGDGVQ